MLAADSARLDTAPLAAASASWLAVPRCAMELLHSTMLPPPDDIIGPTCRHDDIIISVSADTLQHSNVHGLSGPADIFYG